MTPYYVTWSMNMLAAKFYNMFEVCKIPPLACGKKFKKTKTNKSEKKLYMLKISLHYFNMFTLTCVHNVLYNIEGKMLYHMLYLVIVFQSVYRYS